MILFVNVYLVGNNSKLTYDRGLLPQDDKLKIFKYMLSSMSVISFKKVYINYELDKSYGDIYNKTNSYIKNLFGDNCIIRNKRNQYQSEWKISVEELREYNKEFIWFSCNDDHIFIDKDLNMVNAIEEKLQNLHQANKYVTSGYTHWPESSNKYFTNEIVDEDKKTFTIKVNDISAGDSIQIISYELFEYWWTSMEYGEEYWFPRSDPPGRVKGKKIRLINNPKDILTVIPKKEIVRHFDAYSHIKPMVNFNLCPPLTIPKGFFENKISIDYGFERREGEKVFINPTMKDYRVVNEKGVDYKLLINELPLFWQDKILEIRKNEIKDKKFRYYRNLSVLKMLYWKNTKFVSIEKSIKIFEAAFHGTFDVKTKDKRAIYKYIFKINLLILFYIPLNFIARVILKIKSIFN